MKNIDGRATRDLVLTYVFISLMTTSIEALAAWKLETGLAAELPS